MGSAQSPKAQAEVFRAQDWQLVQWEPYTNIKDPTFSSNFDVYVHKHNPNLEIQKYQLYFNSRAEYVSYLEIYYQRKKYPNLVNSIYIEQTTQKGMCSTFLSADIYLQRIHFRLFELIQIPIEEGLFMIESALEGYQKMFNRTGYFDVSSDMIGVNKQGKVKVWFNKNFAKNFPQFNKIDHNKGEPDFILNLVKVIEECVDYPKEMQSFSKFLKKKSIIPTFGIAKSFLKQYHTINKLCPQKIMKSIVLWFKKNSRKNSFSNTQYFNQIKSSSYSFKSNETKKNQESQKTLGHLQQDGRTKKLAFSKLKSKKSNEIFYENHQKSTKICTPQTTPPIIMKDTPLESNFSKEKYIEQQRPTIPINFNTNSAIHMSFLKNQRRPFQLQQTTFYDQFGKFPLKNVNKLPSVSFSYKSSGIYSPQNIEVRQNQWFSSKITLNPASKQRRIESRRSMILDNSTQDLDQKLKIYFTSEYAHQIDPEIVKDLYTIQNPPN